MFRPTAYLLPEFFSGDAPRCPLQDGLFLPNYSSAVALCTVC